MGLFGNKKDERKLSFAMGGYKFKADDNYLSYQSIYGKSFRVLKADMESVSLDKGGLGKNIIKINGRGTTLAQVELPKQWSEKAQEFIQNEIPNHSKQPQNGHSELDELEKLSDLKEKGILTQEEFEQKKKQLLGL